MENFEVGDLVECVKAFDGGYFYSPISVGDKFVVNRVNIGHCGSIGLDIGMHWKITPPIVTCNNCKAVVPIPARPYYRADRFRKIQPEYRVVEVAKELLIEAEELISLTEKIDI